MKKRDIITGVTIEKLILGWIGLGKTDDGKKILISGGAIPGSVLSVKVLKNKKNYIQWQIVEVEKKSPLEEKLPDHFQVYGGCKWLPISYENQCKIKEEQVEEVFHSLKKRYNISPKFHPIVPSKNIYGYRNKVEFSFGKYISKKEEVHDEFRFGFHKQGAFDRIINCTFCVLADEYINSIFKYVDTKSRKSKIPTYDQKFHTGYWRHLVIRKSESNDNYMLIFSVASGLFKWKIPKEVKKILTELPKKFSKISSLYVLHNDGKADIVQGDLELIHGEKTIVETVNEKDFHIGPKSFFQTNTKGANLLYDTAKKFMKHSEGILFDLYAGTGTIGIIMSDTFKEVYSVELVPNATEDNKKNLTLNGIKNVSAINGKVEEKVQELQEKNIHPDVIIIDPPRAGMHPDAPGHIRDFNAKEIIYVSCNPATLARDVEEFIKDDLYKITDVQAVDMFPHTNHIETVLRMEKK